MLIVDSFRRTHRDSRIADLPEILWPGDLLVLNDAATLPASLPAMTSQGSPVEIRLARQHHGSQWTAVLLGEGDWRIPTEARQPPVKVSVGERLLIQPDFEAKIIEILDPTSRLVVLRFNRDTAGMWMGIYAYGKPIQYSYLKGDLSLWSNQTVYASRPWAMEMPSAGYPLSWSVLLELRRRGIGLACLTHAAGISAIGPKELDASLPLSEAFDIPAETAETITQSRFDGRRIIAVGTTVVRALESCALALNGQIRAGRGETDLIIDENFHPRIVNGILTGLHDPTQSHYRLLRAFADAATLASALERAVEVGYRCHEFGDSCLIV